MNTLSLRTLGRHIQELRTARGVSLSQLALDAGIAKSNLSRLEQGNGNPTLDTLWRLAVQLDVPFGDLVAPISDPVEDNGFLLRLIDQGNDSPRVDVYWMSCAPHSQHQSKAHNPGSRESITVISGQIDVCIDTDSGTETTQVSAGEIHSFASDRPHYYQTFESWTTVMVTMIYGEADA